MQAVAVKIYAKNAANAPVMIAPIMLVAANGINKSTTDKRIVPKIPTNTADVVVKTQVAQILCPLSAVAIRVAKRNKTAIPKATTSKTGVTVITPVMRRNATIMPITILEIAANNKQSFLHSQLKNVIYSPP